MSKILYDKLIIYNQYKIDSNTIVLTIKILKLKNWKMLGG